LRDVPVAAVLAWQSQPGARSRVVLCEGVSVAEFALASWTSKRVLVSSSVADDEFDHNGVNGKVTE
jgi:hypothetical protein